MNLIDPIKNHLAAINADIPSWRLQMKIKKTTKGLATCINAYNEIEYKGRFNDRMASFYVQYEIDQATFDIDLKKIVFNQLDVKNQFVRDRLSEEMMRKLKLKSSDLKEKINAQLELEKAVRIILAVTKEV